MLGAFSTDTYLPAFPSIAGEFRIGLDVVQQTLTVYLLAMAVMTLFHGTLSDASGPTPSHPIGLVFYVAASVGVSFRLAKTGDSDRALHRGRSSAIRKVAFTTTERACRLSGLASSLKLRAWTKPSRSIAMPIGRISRLVCSELPSERECASP
jgi:hypothetical protein